MTTRVTEGARRDDMHDKTFETFDGRVEVEDTLLLRRMQSIDDCILAFKVPQTPR